uniref:Mannose-specific lectin n=1 Tax=Anthurium amnicola TaxID=1678845 RepID=A0A1D1Y7E0_9ARAE
MAASTRCSLLFLLLQAILLLNVLPRACTAGEILTSPGKLQSGQQLAVGKFKFVMRPDCKLVLTEGSKELWSSGNSADVRANCTAVLKADALLRVYDQWCTALWRTDAGDVPHQQAALTLHPNGDVGIYVNPVWSSGTKQWPEPILISKRVLLAPNKLLNGQYLTVGTHKFMVEDTCSLTLFQGGRRLWTTGPTNSVTGCYVSLGLDGKLRLYDQSNNKVWESESSENHSPILIMQPDREAVIYKDSVWGLSGKPQNSSALTETVDDESETIRMVA